MRWSQVATLCLASASLGSAGCTKRSPQKEGDGSDSSDPATKIITQIRKDTNFNRTACDEVNCPDDAFVAKKVWESFSKYEIKDRNVQISLVSLMVAESESWLYKRNQWPEPGRPGQGTATMQQLGYNLEYAVHLGLEGDALENLKKIKFDPDRNEKGEDEEQDLSLDLVSDDFVLNKEYPELDEVKYIKQIPDAERKACDAFLELVIVDEYNFASAAWFFKNKCDDGVKKAFEDSAEKGFQKHMKECVKVVKEGKELDEGRISTWDLTKKVFDANPAK